jgi:quercetin dioxygenase-like cupin family protein
MSPEVGNALVWATDSMPVDLNGGEPPTQQLEPAPNGTIFRILELPPGIPPRMHKTETIDYVIVLDGEVDMLLDDSEVHMKAGDVMVQKGTWHGWTNRSDRPCRIAFVLIDAR